MIVWQQRHHGKEALVSVFLYEAASNSIGWSRIIIYASLLTHYRCTFYFLPSDNPQQLEIGKMFLKSIMSNYEKISNSDGMKRLIDVVSLESGMTRNVVLRNITESFWLKVIETTEKKRVCALGTPGVGKTTTTCILIRLLLEQNKTVVYRVRNDERDGYAYMFIPSSDIVGHVDVQVIQERLFLSSDIEVDKPSIYYVVDPGLTKSNCNLRTDFKGKVIIIASPDERNWGGAGFRKDRDGVMGTFLFFPVWNLLELSNAGPYINPNITMDDIEDRYQKVGGIPRHIFGDIDEFAMVLDDQETAINGLSEIHVRRLALGNIASAQTFGMDQPKSILMVYQCSDPNFKKFTVSVASSRVAQLLVQSHKTVLWNVILDKGGTRGSTAWQAFELYCQNLMLGSKSKNYFDYKYHDGTILQEEPKFSGSSIQLGNCTKIKETRESLIVAAKREGNEHIVFHSSYNNYPLYDFLYRKANIFYAFQVSIGKTHSCQPHQLKAAIDEAGDDYVFLLHYLTFDERYDNFKLDPVNPFTDDISSAVRSSTAKDWTIKVIRVPSPNEDHGGRSKKLDRNLPNRILSNDQLSNILSIPVSGDKPPFIEQLLSIDTSKLSETIPQFRIVEVQACLRALQLPSNQNKQILIQQLLKEEQKLIALIELLRNAT
jgi:hypothetical protein